MKVSVIVPVYDVAPYLRRCLDSLVGQTLRDIEIICVDDGSTDGSGAILDEYAAKDERVRVIHQPNAGAGMARNAGLDVATGEYLFFCDPDDCALPQMLERLQDVAEKSVTDIVLCGRIQEGGRTKGRIPIHVSAVFPKSPRVFAGSDFPSDLFVAARGALWDKLFRRKHVEGNNIRFQAVQHANDVLFVCLALATARRIVTDDHAYYIHFDHRPGSLQGSRDHAPLSFIEAYDAVRAELAKRSLEGVFANAILGFLLQHVRTGILRFRDSANVDAFYRAFRERLRLLTEGRPLDPFLGFADRRLIAIALRHESPDAFLREARLQRLVRYARKRLKILLGIRIREV